MKVQYVDLNGTPYFESIIHEDMLKSDEEDTQKLWLAFSGNLQDSSAQRSKVVGAATYVADRHGKPGAAAKPGYGGLTIRDTAAVSLGDRTFSIGFWIKPQASPLADSIVFSNGSPTGGVTLSIDTQGHLKYVDHSSGNVFTVPYVVAFERWQHVLWKYDNVKRTLSLYLNGLLAQRWTNVAAPKASSEEMHVATSFEGGRFMGALDEVNIYGNLLPDEAIKDLAEYEPGGSEVLQLSGAQKTLIPSDQINPALSGDFTIEFWGRLNASPSTNGKILASNSRVNNNTTGISFEFPDSKRLNIVLGTNGSGWKSISETGQPWKIGEWNHVAVTATRNGNLILYVNGELLGQTSFTGYVPNPTGLGLGDSPYYAGEANAELEELRVWGRALSQAEIRQGMHLPAKSGTPNLVLYYDFNGVGTTQVVSKGSNPYVLPLVGANIVDGTCPVQRIPHRYRNLVAANWSVRNESGAGLYLSDPVSNLNSNLLIGYHRQTRAVRWRRGENFFRLKGTWLAQPNNLLSGNLSIDLGALLENPEAITEQASRYWLVQEPFSRGRSSHQEDVRIEGVADGNVIRFANVPLVETATYSLIWRSDRGEGRPILPRPGSGPLRP
jgi:hypothetical protein